MDGVARERASGEAGPSSQTRGGLQSTQQPDNGRKPRTTTSIVWLRRDLRLDDNPALNAALRQGGNVVRVGTRGGPAGCEHGPAAAGRRPGGSALRCPTQKINWAGGGGEAGGGALGGARTVLGRFSCPSLQPWLRRRVGEYKLARRVNVARVSAPPPPQVCVYIWSPEEEGQFQPGRCNRWWLHNSLNSLQAAFRKMNSRLILRRATQARHISARPSRRPRGVC